VTLLSHSFQTEDKVLRTEVAKGFVFNLKEQFQLFSFVSFYESTTTTFSLPIFTPMPRLDFKTTLKKYRKEA